MTGIYDPPVSGPLAGLNPDQIENLLLRAVLADLKAGGWDPASISNRSKCELGERLRLVTGLQPRQRGVRGVLRQAENEFFYHRDWSGIGIEEFASRLDEHLRYYCEGRIKQSLGWLSPNEYRRSLGYAA